MPGQRAEGTRVRGLAFPDALWGPAQAKAARLGLSLTEVIKRLLTDWLNEPD